MKAAYINQTGPPENIIVGDLPTPEPTGNQVLVRVAAAALNPVDTYIRGGTMQDGHPAAVHRRLRPGRRRREASGPRRSDSSGRSRVGHQPGPARPARHVRRVRGRRRRAGCIRRPTASATTRPPPARWSASPPTWAWCATPSCKPAKRCSSTAAPAASARWSCKWPRPSARASSPPPAATRKSPSCRELGADAAINYKTEDVAARVKEFAPDGVNVWWETLREPNFDTTVPLLAAARPDDPHGRPRRPADVSRRPVLREGLPPLRLRDVQRHARRAARRRRRHQPLARRRQDQAAHRPHHAARPGRRRPQAGRHRRRQHGISAERVRQLEREALQKLRRLGDPDLAA